MPIRLAAAAVLALLFCAPALAAPNACALFPAAEAAKILGGPVIRYRTPSEAADGPVCSYWSGETMQEAAYAEVIIEPAGAGVAEICRENGAAAAETPAGPACRTAMFAAYILGKGGQVVRTFVGPIHRREMDAAKARALAETVAARLPQ